MEATAADKPRAGPVAVAKAAATRLAGLAEEEEEEEDMATANKRETTTTERRTDEGKKTKHTDEGKLELITHICTVDYHVSHASHGAFSRRTRGAQPPTTSSCQRARTPSSFRDARPHRAERRAERRRPRARLDTRALTCPSRRATHPRRIRSQENHHHRSSP